MIGRPVKLAGIEREMDYRAMRPMRELRAHAYSHFRADNRADALVHVLRSASQLGQPWMNLNSGISLDPERDVAEPVWYRGLKPGEEKWADYPESQTPNPALTTVMVTLRVDTGNRLRRGYTIIGDGENERPASLPNVSNCTEQVPNRLVAIWSAETTTSKKQTLFETHGPALQHTFRLGTAELINVEKRSSEVGPYRYRVRQTLDDFAENAVIAACLQRSQDMHICYSDTRCGSQPILTGIRRCAPASGASQLTGFELRSIVA
jgi:hypothetical protein